MSIVNFSTVTDSGTFALTNGAAPGRAVIVLVTQERNPPSVTGVTFNGVTGTTYGQVDSFDGAARTLAVRFTDAQLPATAGTYNVATISGGVGAEASIIELSGMDNSAAPEVITKAVGSGLASDAITFTNAAGAFLGIGFTNGFIGNNAVDASQTIFLDLQAHHHSGKIATTANDSLTIQNLNNTKDTTYTAISFAAGATNPVTRKGSTFDIETTLGTITTASLNGVNIADHISGQVGTTVSFAGAATDEITTSGEYSLVLGDGTGTETITVQVNVVGLASFNINKDGADQGSLTDVEFIILTGTAGSRAINQQITGITTTAGGDTGTIEITDTALNVDDTITVVQQSPTVGGGLVHTATLELI